MKFENPRLPDEINVSRSSPLADFLALALGIVVMAALATVVLYFAAGYLAARVPFGVEARLADRFVKPPAGATDAERALQALADRLSPHLDLPPGMTVRVHYQDSPVVNALATLGGHVFMYRGLLERLPNENALAMVLAHEIAHVKHRDAAMGAGRGVALVLAVSAVSSGAGDQLASKLIGSTTMLTALTFNRDQETAADEAALAALARVYGHVGGAVDLFRIFEALRGAQSEPPRVLATHPLTADRVARIEALARARGWRTEGPITALPEALRVKK